MTPRSDQCWLKKCHSPIGWERIHQASANEPPVWWVLKLCLSHGIMLETSADERGGYSQARKPPQGTGSSWWPWAVMTSEEVAA